MSVPQKYRLEVSCKSPIDGLKKDHAEGSKCSHLGNHSVKCSDKFCDARPCSAFYVSIRTLKSPVQRFQNRSSVITCSGPD